jgi:hypothetical protein
VDGCAVGAGRPVPDADDEAVEVVPAAEYENLRAHRDRLWKERDDAREQAAKWEALARRLYRLIGEDAERLLPGDVESVELLRDDGVT